MPIHAYTLRSHQWETICSWCGSPIFFGETVYESTTAPESPCCSGTCAEQLAFAVEQASDSLGG